MKLTLTILDLKRTLSAYHNIPADFELEIVQNANSTKLENVIKIVEALDYRVSHKIAAIKAFRTEIPTGLAEAKYIIENWDSWKAAALKKGDIPNMYRLDNTYNFQFS